jgi:lipid-A-disaccharide synthase
MALLPFEVPFFAQYGVPCTYVSHPVIDSGAERGDGTAFRKRHAIPAEATLLCVLPGSRSGEVRRMLPVFGKALMILKAKHPDLGVVIPVVEPVAEAVTEITRDWPLPALLVSNAERFDAFAAFNAAMAKSGTVTLELALANVPMAVAYWISPASAFLVRRMGVGVEHASLVNLLVGRQAVPESCKKIAPGPKIAGAILELLGSGEARASQRRAFREVAKALGEGASSPSERAAKVVLDIVGAKSGASTTLLSQGPKP